MVARKGRRMRRGLVLGKGQERRQRRRRQRRPMGYVQALALGLCGQLEGLRQVAVQERQAVAEGLAVGQIGGARVSEAGEAGGWQEVEGLPLSRLKQGLLD